MDLKFKINPGHVLAVCEGGMAEGGWQETASVSSLCQGPVLGKSPGSAAPKGASLRGYSTIHLTSKCCRHPLSVKYLT